MSSSDSDCVDDPQPSTSGTVKQKTGVFYGHSTPKRASRWQTRLSQATSPPSPLVFDDSDDSVNDPNYEPDLDDGDGTTLKDTSVGVCDKDAMPGVSDAFVNVGASGGDVGAPVSHVTDAGVPEGPMSEAGILPVRESESESGKKKIKKEG